MDWFADENDMEDDIHDIYDILWEEDEEKIRRPRCIRQRNQWFDNYDEVDFTTRFRLSKETTLHILHLIQHKLDHSSTRNYAIPPILQLLAALRFYATGSTQLSAGDYGGFSKTSAHRIVHRVSAAIAQLLPTYVCFPSTQEEIRKTQLGFHSRAKFPKVVGAMDCTHIKIKSPGGSEAELYRNRKTYFSLNVQAICNSNLEFTDIVAKWPGSTHDSTIFNNSYRRAMFEAGKYGDAILLVDAGYQCRSYLMPPLDNPSSAAEHLYNESQIRTRSVVERPFGVWKRRFPVLAIGLQVSLNNALPIIVATAVLHNILRQRGEEVPPDDPAVELPVPWRELISQGQMNPTCAREGRGHTQRQFAARRALIDDYFQSLVERA